MSDRRFSAAERALIARIEKAGASWEENHRHGWGFFHAGDRALKLIKKGSPEFNSSICSKRVTPTRFPMKGLPM